MIKKRNTKQKELLLNSLSDINIFFTAEDLLNKVQKTTPSIGIATIYRFLNEIKSEGKLHSYTCDRKTIYSNQKNNHSHYICEKCKKISHIKIDNIDFIKNNIPGSICHFQIEVYGVCDSCLKKSCL
jgi:Fe2+ or Zn2+ uptake regulation protein